MKFIQKFKFAKNKMAVCHSVVPAILKRYVKLRLHVLAKENNKKHDKKQVLASKTAARSCIC